MHYHGGMAGQDTPNPKREKRTSMLSESGTVVDLDHYVDTERENRGWRTDRIEASVEGEPAGYLKLSYIPGQEWERRYPTAFEYATSGLTGGYHKIKALRRKEPDDAQWSRDDLVKAIENATGWTPYSMSERLEPLSDSEVYEQWRQKRQEIAAKHQTAYDDAKAFHVDSPVISYINVYSADDKDRYVGGNEQGRPVIGHGDDGWPIYGPNMQRQGIGTVLYEAGALWMHERGLTMHASGIQTTPARAAWARLAQKYDIGTVEIPDSQQPGGLLARTILTGSQVRQKLESAPTLSGFGEGSDLGSDAPDVQTRQIGHDE